MPHSERSPISLVWELFISERKPISVIVTYEIVVGLVSLTVPIAVQTVVNTLAFTQLLQPIVILAAAVLLGQVIGVLLKSAQVILAEKLQRRLFAHLGMELAYRIPRMERNPTTNLTERVNRFFDIVTLQKSIAFLVLDGFALALQVVIGLVLLAFYHPALLAFDVVLVVAILFVLLVLGKGAIPSSIEESYAKYAVVAWLEDVAAKVVTFSSRRGRFLAAHKSNKLVDIYLDARSKHFKVLFRQVFGFLSLQAIANSTLLVLGAWLVSKNQLSIGQLVASEIVVSTVMYSLARFQKHLENFYDLVAGVDKISGLIDNPLETGGKLAFSDANSVEVEFSDVEYHFDMNQRHFGPLSLKVQRGEHLAVHGSNGSGKSTIIDLLFGFKNPDKGSILLNGQDIRLFSKDQLREHVAMVRGVEIVNGTILENLSLGKSGVSSKRMSEILESLGLLKSFLNFPDGLHTVLSENGAPLTVSQMKRVMFARAILHNPSLLLVDETLDGLDETSRQCVLDLLFDKEASRTVIIASQRDQVECCCDTLLDLDKRKVEVS